MNCNHFLQSLQVRVPGLCYKLRLHVLQQWKRVGFLQKHWDKARKLAVATHIECKVENFGEAQAQEVIVHTKAEKLHHDTPQGHATALGELGKAEL